MTADEPQSENTESELPRPFLLTSAELSKLRSALNAVYVSDGGMAHQAHELVELLDDPSRRGNLEYGYSLAGPWGTIKEGNGSLEATIAGCRDARAQHWKEGHGRDDRYNQIQVERYAQIYFTDPEGWDDLGFYTGPGERVEVSDTPLTDEEQAESDARLVRRQERQTALYAQLARVPRESAGA